MTGKEIAEINMCQKVYKYQKCSETQIIPNFAS